MWQESPYVQPETIVSPSFSLPEVEKAFGRHLFSFSYGG